MIESLGCRAFSVAVVSRQIRPKSKPPALLCGLLPGLFTCTVVRVVARRCLWTCSSMLFPQTGKSECISTHLCSMCTSGYSWRIKRFSSGFCILATINIVSTKVLATINDGGGWGKRILPKLHDLGGGGGSAGAKDKSFNFFGAQIVYATTAGNEALEAGPDPLLAVAAGCTGSATAPPLI